MNAIIQPAPTTAPSPVSAPKVMLVGASGTGKTHSIRTLLAAGIDVFIVATEYPEVLEDTDPKHCHWHYIRPAQVDWAALIDSADKINKFDYNSLSKLTDINKSKHRQFLEVLTSLRNFKCDRTGVEYGDASTWGPDRAIIVDSLSGLNIMAMDLVVGSKPTKAMSDWMVAMDNLERLINALTTGTQCWFVLTAHLERETDEVSGGIQLMASTLGRKLAPKLPRFFSDVILARREGTKFTWSTAALNVDLKTRNLPISDGLLPDFAQIVRSWKTRQTSGVSSSGLATTPSNAS